MLRLSNVTKKYRNTVIALDQVNLTVDQGEFVIIVGPSGAGKSTLLRTINGLTKPDSGNVYVRDRDMTTLKPKEMRLIRRQIGLIFQDYNLVERSPVLTNVLMGRLGYTGILRSLLGVFSAEDVALAHRCIERVGLTDKLYQRAGELSGGQKQRVSIARALTQQPLIILADEPVASLDPPTAHEVMSYFRRINEEEGVTIVMNLHDINLAAGYGKRIVGMRDGRIVHDSGIDKIDAETFTQIYGRRPYMAELEVTR